MEVQARSSLKLAPESTFCSWRLTLIVANMEDRLGHETELNLGKMKS